MKRLFSMTVMAGLALSLAACSDTETLPEPPRPVKTVIADISPGVVEFVQTGEISPRTETDIGFRADGRVVSRNVEVGQMVKVGELIAVVDDGRSENDLQVAEAERQNATSLLELANAQLKRQQKLFQTGVIAKARLEEAQSNVDSANSRKQAAEATLANARQRLDDARLVSKVEGIVTAVGANPGQVVAAGQMIVRLASSSELDAVFNVSDTIIQSVPKDVRITVRLVSDAAVKTTGAVREVSPVADPASRTYRVRIALKSPPAAMALGASVLGQAEVETTPHIIIPASAITSEGNMAAVYVVSPGTGALVRKKVEVIRYSAEDAVIGDGIKPGERVVVAGVSKLRPNQIVSVEGLQ
jgi:RND family efflux transporter MFP subunit